MSGRLARLLSRLDPSCRDVMGLISRSFDLSLGRADRIIVAIHMLHCPACRRSRRHLALLISTLRRLGRGPASEVLPKLPEETRERIIQTLRQE